MGVGHKGRLFDVLGGNRASTQWRAPSVVVGVCVRCFPSPTHLLLLLLPSPIKPIKQVFVPSVPATYDPTHHADILAALGPMPSEAEWQEKGLDKYGLVVVNTEGNAAQVRTRGFGGKAGQGVVGGGGRRGGSREEGETSHASFVKNNHNTRILFTIHSHSLSLSFPAIFRALILVLLVLLVVLHRWKR